MTKVMDGDDHVSAGFEVVFRGSGDDIDDNNTAIVEESSNGTYSRTSVGEAYHWSKGMDGNSTVNAVTVLEEDSPLRETRSDPFKKPRWWREASSLSVIIAGMIAFCVLITIALIIQILVGAPQIVPHAGVLSDDDECSRMGLELLKGSSRERVEDATSVDAAILTSLCLMVKNPHKGGLGGGGFMLVEEQHKEKAHLTEINFREMSLADTDSSLNVSKDQISRAQSVAVPGYLSGILKAHGLFGKKPLKFLFEKAAKLASNGVSVNEELADAIETLKSDAIPDDLKALLTKDDNTTFLNGNDTLRQPSLAETLLAIGRDSKSFYSGDVGRALVSTLRDLGSKITLNDMRNYSASVENDVFKLNYRDIQVAATGLPSSGPVLLSTLNMLKRDGNHSAFNNATYHRIIEALKFSYGYQASWVDGSDVKEMLGSATSTDRIRSDGVYSFDTYAKGVQPLDLNSGGEQHVTVIGHDHQIVTMVTGIGSSFGSKVLTSGFLMNDAMLDFSWGGKNPAYDPSVYTPSRSNYIAPKKRPASSMLVALLLPNNTKCGLYMGFDAHAWTSAISSLVQIIVRKTTGADTQSSVDQARISQTMMPFETFAEASSNSSGLVSFLEGLGHNVTTATSLGVCSALRYLEGSISFYGDARDRDDVAQIF